MKKWYEHDLKTLRFLEGKDELKKLARRVLGSQQDRLLQCEVG